MKNVKKLNDMSSSDLEKEIVQLKSELFKLRFNGATSGSENKIKIREVRKNIARAKTILRKRELEKTE